MAYINNLQWFRSQMHDGFTESNMLANALLTTPEISMTLAYVNGKAGQSSYLSYLTEGSGRVSIDPTPLSNNVFKWSLMGDITKAVSVTVAASPSSNTGQYGQIFTFGTEEKYFSVGDVLRSDSGTLIRIQAEPYQSGKDFIYTAALAEGDVSTYLSTTDGAVGAQFSFEFSAFEEGSQGGSSKQATPMWFQNQLGIMRASYGMTGDAQTDIMVLKNSKTGSMLWQPFQEWQFNRQWDHAIARALWYSKYNADSNGNISLKGANGRIVRIGAGIFDQIGPYGKRFYTKGTERLYRSLIGDAYMNSAQSDGNKKFVAITGRGGWEEFQNAMKDSIHASNIVDTHFLTSNGENLTFGAEVTTYKGIFGTELTIIHDPMFDDETHNRRKHPKTGYPIESYRMCILDFSTYGGESNIQMVCKKGRENVTFYTAGAATPLTPQSSQNSMLPGLMRSNDIDGWYVHKLTTRGIKIINPTSCIDLQLAID